MALRTIARAVDRYSRYRADSGINSTQLTVLRELAEHPGMPLGEIARRVHLAQATVSETIKQLVERGCVSRSRSEIDRRQVLCSITPHGRELALLSPPLPEDQILNAFASLPDWEQSSLLAALQRVAAMVEPAELTSEIASFELEVASSELPPVASKRSSRES